MTNDEFSVLIEQAQTQAAGLRLLLKTTNVRSDYIAITAAIMQADAIAQSLRIMQDRPEVARD